MELRIAAARALWLVMEWRRALLAVLVLETHVMICGYAYIVITPMRSII